MRLALLLLTLSLVGCVAPSMTIYGRGVIRNEDGTSKVVAVKEFQMYSDSVGRTEVVTSNVHFTSEGGVYNSTVIRESGDVIAKTGRSWFQPLMSWLGIGAGINALGGAANAAADAVP